jgi:hypothetical protein
MSDSLFPRDFAGAFGSVEHLTRLLVRDLWGEWRYYTQSNKWFRRVDDERWIESLPPREACQIIIDRVAADAEKIPGELREYQGDFVDQMLARVREDFRVWYPFDAPVDRAVE